MWRWITRLFPKRLRVTVDGKGYRVNGEWCETQVEVRQRLEQLDLPESEIIRILRELNAERYGHPGR
jgi:hypothetical protein